MSNTPIALAYSDIHKHNFTDFSVEPFDRFRVSLEVEKFIFKKARALQIPILFTGDMFDSPKSLENEVIEESMAHYKDNYDSHKNAGFYGISGNHDMAERNTRTNTSPTYLRAFDKVFDSFKLVDFTKATIVPGIDVYGIPYLHDDEYWFETVKALNKEVGRSKYSNRLSILLIHKTLPNCPTPLGFAAPASKKFPNNLDKIWSNFNLILSGHIHKPQMVSEKCYMLGSPIHQNRGDAGCEMGYWEIYRDRVVFKSLNEEFPNFVKLKPNELPYNSKDYFIEPNEILNPNSPTNEKTKTFDVNDTRGLVKTYYKSLGIKDKGQRNLVIEIINKAKE